MRVEEFVARRQESWRELENGIKRARRGRLRGMSAQDLERFGMLYRRAAGDLAIAARDFPDQPITEYLNSLLTRAHPLLFRGPSPQLSRVWRFYAVELPRAVRAARVYVLASLGLFLLGALAGWLAVVLRPDLVASLVPPQVLDGLSQGHVGNTELSQFAPLLAAFIIQNNVMVSLIALVSGVALGLPTAFLLLSNGWMLGTLGAAVHQAGIDAGFWALIVPHGAIEISVIVIAGGAGLMIGDSLLRPGLIRRVDSLAAAGQRALVLGLGVAPLLLVAGLIESFVTPSDLAIAAKLAVGAVTGVLLWSWFLLAGRRGAAGRRAPAVRPSLDVPTAA
ncbi:MAG TPA: stage II sporulation protein M [Candidatus Dormibacteraeota bacterium]|nr:stage II sporulation protein M [Candidatus Dormibacteraeota bacterium]